MADSKSAARKGVGVRIPPAVLKSPGASAISAAGTTRLIPEPVQSFSASFTRFASFDFESLLLAVAP